MKKLTHFVFVLTLTGLMLISGCSAYQQLKPLLSFDSPGAQTSLQTENAQNQAPAITASSLPTQNSLDPLSARATTLAQQIPQYDNPFSTPQTQPTNSSSPTLPPPTPTATPTRLPLSTSDLLFLADNRLLRWDHFTGYSSLIAENVVAFSASADGRLLVLLRPQNIVANGQALFDVDLMDYQSKTILSLIKQKPYPQALSLSPDGKWIAYISEDGTVIAHPIAAELSSLKLGNCVQPDRIGESNALTNSSTVYDACQQLAWSYDNRQVAWSDERGLWLATLESGNQLPTNQTTDATLLHKAEVTVTDPKGSSSQVSILFSDLRWSPNGRFIMTRLVPSLQGVQWQAIIDTRLGKLAHIPDTAEYGQKLASVAWLYNSTLIVASGGEANSQGQPFISIYLALPTSTNLLSLNTHVKIPFANFPNHILENVFSDQNLGGQNACLSWIWQQDENTFSLGLSFPENQSLAFLFHINLLDQRPQILIELPPETLQVYWAQDGSGALISSTHGFFYYSRQKGSLTALGPEIISTNSHSFHWLPPVIRRR
jgi:hypothetical protein